MRVVLFGNCYKKEAKLPLETLFRLFGENGAEVHVEKDFYAFMKEKLGMEVGRVETFVAEMPPMADLALSVGGDGTFLTTARCVGDRDIPILGINTGNLGFLADCKADSVEAFFDDYVAGKCYVEERSLLEVSVDEEVMGCALNEVAVLKQDSSSMIRVKASVNGEFLNEYKGDGLVVATPTGSTAYSMSVGGPIVSPSSKSVIVSPVAPHSLGIRPLVIPDDVEMDLVVESREHKYLLAIDGQSEVYDQCCRVKVRRAPYSIKAVKRVNQSYFQTLRSKLMWGQNPTE